MASRERAVLVFEDGRRFHGYAYGVVGRTHGQAVSVTDMTGYQEVVTDPARDGQVVIMTTPHIGNTGVNDEDRHSETVRVAGLVVRDPARIVSNFRAMRSLDEDLAAAGTVGIAGIDTRAATRHLRTVGPLHAGIFSGPDADLTESEQHDIVAAHADNARSDRHGERSDQSPTEEEA